MDPEAFGRTKRIMCDSILYVVLGSLLRLYRPADQPSSWTTQSRAFPYVNISLGKSVLSLAPLFVFSFLR